MKGPGWLNTQLSKARPAVVPGYSHYNFITSAEVPQIIGKFLADQLTNPPTGQPPPRRPRRRLRRSGKPESETGEDRFALAPSGRALATVGTAYLQKRLMTMSTAVETRQAKQGTATALRLTKDWGIDQLSFDAALAESPVVGRCS